MDQAIRKVGGGGQWLFQGLGRELSWRQPLASFLGSPCTEFSWQLRGIWATPTLHLATISVPFSGYSQVLEAWVRLTTGKPQRNGFEAASRQGGEGSSSSDPGANEEWGEVVGSQVRGGGTVGEELPLPWQCLLLNYIPLHTSTYLYKVPSHRAESQSSCDVRGTFPLKMSFLQIQRLHVILTWLAVTPLGSAHTTEQSPGIQSSLCL